MESLDITVFLLKLIHMLAICLAMLETEEDQRRFTRLFEAHEKKIYAVALRVLGDPNRAEDAAQQTWLQLIKN